MLPDALSISLGCDYLVSVHNAQTLQYRRKMEKMGKYVIEFVAWTDPTQTEIPTPPRATVPRNKAKKLTIWMNQSSGLPSEPAAEAQEEEKS